MSIPVPAINPQKMDTDRLVRKPFASRLFRACSMTGVYAKELLNPTSHEIFWAHP
jgi:hypothetical protein